LGARGKFLFFGGPYCFLKNVGKIFCRGLKIFPDIKKKGQKNFSRLTSVHLRFKKISPRQILVKTSPISAKFRFGNFFLNPLFISKNVPHYFFYFPNLPPPPLTLGARGKLPPLPPSDRPCKH
jgi:hypothetical protein